MNQYVQQLQRRGDEVTVSQLQFYINMMNKDYKIVGFLLFRDSLALAHSLEDKTIISLYSVSAKSRTVSVLPTSLQKVQFLLPIMGQEEDPECFTNNLVYYSDNKVYRNDALLFETPENIVSMHQYSQDTFAYTTKTNIIVRRGDKTSTLPFATLFAPDTELRINNIQLCNEFQVLLMCENTLYLVTSARSLVEGPPPEKEDVVVQSYLHHIKHAAAFFCGGALYLQTPEHVFRIQNEVEFTLEFVDKLARGVVVDLFFKLVHEDRLCGVIRRIARATLSQTDLDALEAKLAINKKLLTTDNFSALVSDNLTSSEREYHFTTFVFPKSSEIHSEVQKYLQVGKPVPGSGAAALLHYTLFTRHDVPQFCCFLLRLGFGVVEIIAFLEKFVLARYRTSQNLLLFCKNIRQTNVKQVTDFHESLAEYVSIVLQNNFGLCMINKRGELADLAHQQPRDVAVYSLFHTYIKESRRRSMEEVDQWPLSVPMRPAKTQLFGRQRSMSMARGQVSLNPKEILVRNSLDVQMGYESRRGSFSSTDNIVQSVDIQCGQLISDE